MRTFIDEFLNETKIDSKYQWTVRMVSNGIDKSDFYVVRVIEPVGCLNEFLTPMRKWGQKGSQKKFKRICPVVRYRAEARALKKKLIEGKSNVNSWDNQSDFERNY